MMLLWQFWFAAARKIDPKQSVCRDAQGRPITLEELYR